ncbi:MAG: PDZ domain-containing protein [Vicinamibacterales bacterium]
MDHSTRRPPRVSRETRLLLVAALLAVVALWILARLRYPTPTATPPSIAPILAPLVPRPSLDDLAQLGAEPSGRASPRLLSLGVRDAPRADAPRADDEPPTARVAAVRLTGKVAVTLLTQGSSLAAGGPDEIARDQATGLVVVRHEAAGPIPPTVAWRPREPSQPRYLLKTHAYDGGVALGPVLVGALVNVDAPRWGGSVWDVPAGTDVEPGDLVFGVDGEWTGLVVAHGSGRAIVPAHVVSQRADRLVLDGSARPRGTLGLVLQALTPNLQQWSGAAAGAVVSAVEPDGPAEGLLVVGDVLEAADGHDLRTLDHWRRFTADLEPDHAVALRVRRNGQRLDVTVPARRAGTPPEPGARTLPLGWTLQSLPGRGSLVTLVQAGSRAERAGLQAGDVITMAGGIAAPTPAQIQRALRQAPPKAYVLVALRRGTTPMLVALEP